MRKSFFFFLLFFPLVSWGSVSPGQLLTVLCRMVTLIVADYLGFLTK